MVSAVEVEFGFVSADEWARLGVDVSVEEVFEWRESIPVPVGGLAVGWGVWVSAGTASQSQVSEEGL